MPPSLPLPLTALQQQTPAKVSASAPGAAALRHNHNLWFWFVCVLFCTRWTVSLQVSLGILVYFPGGVFGLVQIGGGFVSNISSFFQKVCIKNLLFTKCSCRYWEYDSELDTLVPCSRSGSSEWDRNLKNRCGSWFQSDKWGEYDNVTAGCLRLRGQGRPF